MSKLNAPASPAPRTRTTRSNTTETRWAHVAPLAESLPENWTLSIAWVRRTTPTPIMQPNTPLPPLPELRSIGSVVLVHQPVNAPWQKRYKVTANRGALVSLCARKRGRQSLPVNGHPFQPIMPSEWDTMPAAARRIINKLLELSGRPKFGTAAHS